MAGDTHAAGPATSCATSPWPGTQAAQHRKVTHMTTPSTGQPSRPLIRWLTAPFRAFGQLNQELLAAQEAMARSNRFRQPSPAEAKHVQPAPVTKAPARV